MKKQWSTPTIETLDVKQTKTTNDNLNGKKVLHNDGGGIGGKNKDPLLS